MEWRSRAASASKVALWAGRILTGLVALSFLFDATMKILRLAPAVEGTMQLGYPSAEIMPIGLTLLICLVIYLIPRTSVIGAILLTGYLGGAVASMVRAQNHWFAFPVVSGVLVWLGLFLRRESVRGAVKGN